ncbi:LCP family protein [Arthrobacter cryoconiti]|uniref:LCP family protein n=1 Tax=Arthrobacter cryoconiti TaxID=748907 RepID=A0ABV8QVH0_9MICC|nr:LCP family protein [Arthrobacter cryoconiti]MCC9069504.1 LCP family protein [Arthrobacter cryoconiti]
MARRRAETAAATAAGTTKDESSDTKLPAGRHFKPHRKTALWIKIVAIALSGVLVIGLGAAGLLYLKLQNNITTAPLNAALSPGKGNSSQQPEDTGSLQILILGTDTRAGANSEYGTLADSSGEGNSDVMLLMNISADNSQVSVTSFPRDLMVPIPDCKRPDGNVIYGQAMGQLNSALAGGPGCTVAAINDLTGLTIDHFMLADFTAVKELSTALGGVEVCVDHAMYDVNGSFLKLPAGKSLVQGEQALAFLRTRHAFGDASDLARIAAQQYFLGSLVRKLKSDGTLTNLPQLYTLADVVTKNLTIDQGLANVPAMVSIAKRLAKIDVANVAFVTVPTEPYVRDPNRVQLLEPAAGQFFAVLRNETPLTKVAPTPTSNSTVAPTASSAATVPATAEPTVPVAPAYDKSIQPITVTNGSTVAGRSLELIKALAGQGYTLSSNGGDIAAQNKTTILYGADMADVAHDVAVLFKISDSAVHSDPTVRGVKVVVGTDWISGVDFGTVTVPKDIVSSTAAESDQCLTVNPLYYTY